MPLQKPHGWLKTILTEILDDLIGMHLPPGTAWPIPRLLWLKKHHPRLFDSDFKMMQTKDYIVYRLTGNIHTDVLSLRGLLNPAFEKDSSGDFTWNP